jgi:16S rRNA (uracil1498-N3)-methyltransferase
VGENAIVHTMRQHRFFIRETLHNTGQRLHLTDAEIVHQVTRVLRLTTGDTVILCDNAGHEAVARLVARDSKSVDMMLEHMAASSREPQPQITLYCALLKRDNFELVVQKTTEIGVSRIVPLLTEHVVKQGLRPDRLAKIIKEAAEQSGRGRLPVLEEPMTMPAALEQAQHNDENFFFDSSGQPLPEMIFSGKNIGIFIGPEGGWSEDEINQARASALSIVSLGALTFRAETAAIVASYWATH